MHLLFKFSPYVAEQSAKLTANLSRLPTVAGWIQLKLTASHFGVSRDHLSSYDSARHFLFGLLTNWHHY